MKLFGIKRLPDNCWFEIRNNKSLTLILIRDGEIYSTNDRQQKDYLVKIYREDTDILFLAWTGEYKTDLFLVSKDALYANYVKNGKQTITDYINRFARDFAIEETIEL